MKKDSGEPAKGEPKIKEIPESATPPAESERSEDDDYQLQRAKDLLKGLNILKSVPTTTPAAAPVHTTK